jgi:hypothetical protein
MFDQKLKELRARECEERAERRELERLGKHAPEVPKSIVCLREMLEAEFEKLAIESVEFGELLRHIVPDFHVFLVRLCDGGHLFPRARIKLNLGGIVPDIKHVAGIDGLLTRELTVDLFERPPQRGSASVKKPLA